MLFTFNLHIKFYLFETQARKIILLKHFVREQIAKIGELQQLYLLQYEWLLQVRVVSLCTQKRHLLVNKEFDPIKSHQFIARKIFIF